MMAPLMLAAILLDQVLGEPRRWHPLVGFGWLASAIELRFNRGQPRRNKGLLAWSLAVLPLTFAAWLISNLPGIGWLAEMILLYLAIGLRSLSEHAMPIVRALGAGNVDAARERVGRIVSRNTNALDETGIARATTESVLENGSDAVFAALFWFAIFGGPGVVLYRLANTLDAMWGYRNERFLHFGWAAAKIDDFLNFIPARLVALTYALCGKTRLALACWAQQAPLWDSPNAGPVMAAGAGALGVSLGGPASYEGEIHKRPLLGAGPAPGAVDILHALRLVRRSVTLWVIVIFLIWGLSLA
ncbi:adenosylcobinamide-phosphate synthase [Halopseudomonas xinjiangensis]|uniref:Cobalamin biosynthesis protein CobD n=1 Tax=Halopseudomonas xinjiangensis TaxID=487184 RepID=A0A1H1SA08_9GAMM|nr:adenosylcobinamide-phosphate synthase CbiB [Halopseudomonas xinjiangensis]SDS44638.1 adenosylcobinamide-phosphate synthase [Halopseudomonas xinjiangensis]